MAYGAYGTLKITRFQPQCHGSLEFTGYTQLIGCSLLSLLVFPALLWMSNKTECMLW